MGREAALSSEDDNSSHLVKPFKPLVRKGKLVVVDLAGSERIQKSGPSSLQAYLLLSFNRFSHRLVILELHLHTSMLCVGDMFLLFLGTIFDSSAFNALVILGLIYFLEI